MRGSTIKSVWHPSAASSAVGPVEVDAFMPDLLIDAPLPSQELLTYAAELEARIHSLQDSAQVVQLDGVARMLLRSEAVSSSRIEGLLMGHRRLARAEAGRYDTDATAALDNVKAASEAVERAVAGYPCTTEELLRVHDRLVRNDFRMVRHSGRLRDSQNWIGGNALTPVGAEFVPPPHTEVPRLLLDMCEFAQKDGLATVQAAALHAQFETIHPFADGNGRVGRILLVSHLARKIAPRVIPPISLAFAGNADQYVKGLTSWRFGDADDWYAVFLSALDTATRIIRGLGEEVEKMQDEWQERLGRPRSHSATAALLTHLPAHPIIDVREGAALTGHSEVAVRRAISRLASVDIVRKINIRPGRQGYEVVGVFALLDELERDLGDVHKTPRPTN